MVTLTPKSAGFALLLAAVVLFCFGGAVRAPFVFDDHALLQDPAITSPGGWKEAWRLEQSRPLTWFSFWANYQAHGAWAPGFHAVNLAIHLATSLLVLGCLSKLVPVPAARIAAFLFAVHPVQSEPVIYIFARGTLLAAFFCALSFRSWLSGHHWRAAAWFAPALLAKEECAAFPAFLGLLHLSISKNRSERAPILVMFVMALAAAGRVAVLTVVTPGSGAGSQAGIAPLDYLATQGWVILRYIQLIAIPVGFTVDPDIPVLDDWRGLLCWLVLTAMAILALRGFDRARSGFWFLAGLVLLAPTSSIFPAADLAADRRLYLPMLAFATVGGMLIERTNIPLLLGAGGVLVAMLSFARTDVWMSEASLWEDAMRWGPGKIRPRVQLARASPPSRAYQLLLEARQLAPDDPVIASELGRMYLSEGKASEALKEFGAAVAADPRDALALNNRGVALMALGMPLVATADFQRALELNPCLFDARMNLRKAGQATEMPASCRLNRQQAADWAASR